MKDFCIVAIGGSAGSLKPLMNFFDHTPLDGAAYIIIRHIPKDSQSQLKSILARHTGLQIIQATDGMKVEVNRVYLGPAHKHMVIRGGVFHLIARLSGPNKAIDLFFHSLAGEGLKGSAIAVVLSGAGFDGADGAGAIKDAGGLVIVQAPLSCEFESMPRYTIQTVATDHVLTPSQMPEAIQVYVHAAT